MHETWNVSNESDTDGADIDHARVWSMKVTQIKNNL